MDVPRTLATAVLTGLFDTYVRFIRAQKRLESLRPRLEQARRRLAAPGGDEPLARAYYARLRAQNLESAVERREARRLSLRWLGQVGSETFPAA